MTDSKALQHTPIKKLIQHHLSSSQNLYNL